MIFRKSLSTITIAASLVATTAVRPALAYEGVAPLPHPVVPNNPPPTAQSSWQAMQEEMASLFNDASGGGGTLTQQQAKAAGWGWVSDNFASIDTKGTGHVSLDDICRFAQSSWSQHANATGPNWSPWNGQGNDPWDDQIYPYPPTPNVTITDPNSYSTALDGQIALNLVSEKSSVQRHVMTINGKSVTFTARAGHLIASKVDTTGKTATKAADGTITPGSTPEAAIFYVAYTRDDLPKQERPVTFFWNGGPGSATVWLHLGAYGPQFLDSDAPVVPQADDVNPPAKFPLKDNPITLLDESDLVFIDATGTGFSTAIAPNTNKMLWGTAVDAQVFADAITRYINLYNRQHSPKYIYGESYGGIRTPIVARILLQRGTANYLPDPSPRPAGSWGGHGVGPWSDSAKVLNGVILGSPLLDYSTNCQSPDSESEDCAGFIPNIAMSADYLKMQSRGPNLTRQEYFNQIYQFVIGSDFAAYDAASNNINTWLSYITTPVEHQVAAQLATYLSGVYYSWNLAYQPPWSVIPNQDLVNTFVYSIDFYKVGNITGFSADPYDGRLIVPSSATYIAQNYTNTAYGNQIETYLTNYDNYSNQPVGETTVNGDYNIENAVTIANWNFSYRKNNYAESVTDIHVALTLKQDLKFTVLHGWDDLTTPEAQTYFDLRTASLETKVPIQVFEGGHMTYNTDASRPLIKNALVSFYRATRPGWPNGWPNGGPGGNQASQ
jgi:carboxypeptidase C (cathepsin A)